MLAKAVLLNFWASWCVPCRKEMPSLQALKKKLGEDLEIVAINTDPPNMEGEAIDIIRKGNFDFKVLLDPELLSVEKFQVSGFPETFLISADGKILPINDPGTNERTVRIISERDWGSDKMVDAIKEAIHSAGK